MAQNLAIRLAVVNGQRVKSELKGVGDAGDNALRSVSRSADSATRGLSDMSKSAVRTRTALDSLLTVAKLYAGIRLAQQGIEIADSWQLMTSRLKLATGSTEAAIDAQRRLFDIAQETRAPFEQVAQVFAKLAPSFQRFGTDVETQFTIVKTLGNALLASGASAQEASAGLLQFSQALGSGVLAGDEFKSISENFPALLRAISTATGIAQGDLKKLASEGKLTFEVVTQSLLRQSQDLQGQADTIQRTFGGAMQQLRNDVVKLIGESALQAGVVGDLSAAVDKLRDEINNPEFASGVNALSKAFAKLGDIAIDAISEIGREIELIKSAASAVGDVLSTIRKYGGAVMQGADDAASWLNRLGDSILGTSNALGSARAELSAFFQEASKPRQLTNFAGGANFRSAQDVGLTQSDVAPVAPLVKLGSGSSSSGATDTSRSTQRAAERALKKAQETYARDEKIINDLLREMSSAASERDAAINEQVDKLSGDATDEQISKVRELAGATYDLAQAKDRLEQKTKAGIALDLEAVKLNKENASAADQFAERIRRLDDLRSRGLDQNAYTAEARKASDEAAQAIDDGFERQRDSAQQSYEAMAEFANSAFGGISAGLAEMLVEGEANFESFVKGMVKQVVQSGIQQSLAMLFGAIAGPALAGVPAAQPGASFGNGGLGGGSFFGFHGGGTTDEPSFARFLPAEAFSNAPRYHSGRLGIAPNEIAAILRRDESVLTPGQMKQLAPADRGTEVHVENKIEIINNSSSQVTAQQKPGGGMRVAIDQAVAGAISTPGSTAYRAVQQMVRQNSGR